LSHSLLARRVASFANNVTTQFDGDVVQVTFFQVSPPYIFGDEKEEKDQLEKIKSIKAIPIAKVALTLDVFRKTAANFQSTLKNIEDALKDKIPSNTSN
jgi:hypothetical protein